MVTEMNSLKRMSRAFLRDPGGAVAIEYALLLPLLILLAVGVADYGGLAYRSTQLEAAVRAGVQYALVDGSSGDTSGIQEAVYAAMGLEPATGALTFSITYQYVCPDGTTVAGLSTYCDAADTVSPGYYMRLTVTETYEMWLPYPAIPESYDITEEVMVRVLEVS